MTPLEHLAIAYHKATDGAGEGEYGCNGLTCPGAQRLLALLRAAVAPIETCLAEAEKRERLALEVLAPNMPESGLVDACRQVKQVAISEADNSEKLTADIAYALAQTGHASLQRLALDYLKAREKLDHATPKGTSK